MVTWNFGFTVTNGIAGLVDRLLEFLTFIPLDIGNWNT